MSVTPYKDGWRVVVRKVGHPTISKVFKKGDKSEADQFDRDCRTRMARGGKVSTKDIKLTTVAQLMAKYRDEVGARLKGHRETCYHLDKWQDTVWAQRRLTHDIAGDLREYRDTRLKTCKPATVRRELSIIGSVFNHAIKEWGMPLENPVSKVKLPKLVNRSRKTVWPDEVLHFVVYDYLKFDPEVKPVRPIEYLPWAILLLRHTGLRLGSLSKMNPADIDFDKYVAFLPAKIVKNGEDFECPFNEEAMKWFKAYLKHFPGAKKMFPIDPKSMSGLWTTYRAEILKVRPEVSELRLHDLRHTWTTEQVQLVPDPMTLAKITGRKDLREMMEYYNPDAQALAGLLRKKPVAAAVPAPAAVDLATIQQQLALLLQQTQSQQAIAPK